MKTVNRDSSNDKIKGLINISYKFIWEMEHQYYLNSKIIKVNNKGLRYLKDISFVISLLQNICLLFIYKIYVTIEHNEGNISHVTNYNSYLPIDLIMKLLGGM